MPLHYITGISGSGKSTTLQELRNRGLQAMGTDEDGLAGFYHKETGEQYISDTSAQVRTLEWKAEHTWRIPPEKIQNLWHALGDDTLYLCGVTSNDHEFRENISKTIFLTVPVDILVTRIMTRTNNDYGKNPDELNGIIMWARTAEQEFRDRGAIIIDGSRPTVDVVDEILQLTA
jgi:thymidylate kinase